jgi:hypothetical protein
MKFVFVDHWSTSLILHTRGVQINSHGGPKYFLVFKGQNVYVFTPTNDVFYERSNLYRQNFWALRTI